MKIWAISMLIVLSALFLNACGGGGGGGGASSPPDTTPPTVSITSPTTGTTVAWAYTVTASANDAGGVTRVEFYVNSAFQSSSTAPPYSFRWNTATLPNGNYTLTAKAVDAAGLATISNGIVIAVSHPVITASVSSANVTVPTASVVLSINNAPPLDPNYPAEGVYGVDFTVTFPAGAVFDPLLLTPNISNALASGSSSNGAVLVVSAPLNPFSSGQIVTIPFTNVPTGTTAADFGVTLVSVKDSGGAVIQ